MIAETLPDMEVLCGDMNHVNYLDLHVVIA